MSLRGQDLLPCRAAQAVSGDLQNGLIDTLDFSGFDEPGTNEPFSCFGSSSIFRPIGMEPRWDAWRSLGSSWNIPGLRHG